MLRPATPLTVLLFVAFVLLLISVISTPVVKGIPLASYHGVDFGVFGYCGTKCSGIKVGYATSRLLLSSTFPEVRHCEDQAGSKRPVEIAAIHLDRVHIDFVSGQFNSGVFADSRRHRCQGNRGNQ